MTALPRRLAVLGAVLTGVALGVAGGRIRRLEVTGESMRPELEPGDRVLVWRRRQVRDGDVVAARDPRRPARIMVKRVAGRSGDGWLLVGDNPDASTDSRTFGPVSHLLVLGPVFYRYHPPERAGRVRRGADSGAARPGRDGPAG